MREIGKFLLSAFIVAVIFTIVVVLKLPGYLVALQNRTVFYPVPVTSTGYTRSFTPPTKNVAGIGVFPALLNRQEKGDVSFVFWEKDAKGKVKNLVTKKFPLSALSNNKGLTTLYFPPIKMEKDKVYGFSLKPVNSLGFYLHEAFHVYYAKSLFSQLKEPSWGLYSGADLVGPSWVVIMILLVLFFLATWFLKELLFNKSLFKLK